MLINCVYSSHNIVLCVASVRKWVQTVVENHSSSQHMLAEAYIIITLVHFMIVNTHRFSLYKHIRIAGYIDIIEWKNK